MRCRRMKIRELEDQLSEAHGDLALEASSEKVRAGRWYMYRMRPPCGAEHL